MISTAKHGLTAGCLIVLSSCCSNPVPVDVKEPVPLAPLQPTHRPVFSGVTNGDLVEWCRDLEESLDSCNADKATIQTWSTGD